MGNMQAPKQHQDDVVPTPTAPPNAAAGSPNHPATVIHPLNQLQESLGKRSASSQQYQVLPNAATFTPLITKQNSVQQQLTHCPPGLVPCAFGVPAFGAHHGHQNPTSQCLDKAIAAMLKLDASNRHLLLAGLATHTELASLFNYTDAQAVVATAGGGLGGFAQLQELPPNIDQLIEEELQAAKAQAENQVQGAVPPAAVPAPAARAAGGETGPAAAPALLELSLVPEFKEYGAGEVKDMRLVLSIKAPQQISRQAQVSLTCVLDRSGSMSGTRIQLVKETCHFLITQLTQDDLLGFVSYSNDVTEDVPLLRMTEPAKALAHHAIDMLSADGGTALYAGTYAGIKAQLEAKLDPKIIKSVFLCTDGEANDGPSDADSILPGLAKLQEQYGEQMMVHTFGFGHGHSAKLLQAISESASGVYYYIAASDDIPEGYGDALGGLLAVVAKSIKVSIKPLAGATVSTIKSGGRLTESNPAGNLQAAPAAINMAGAGTTVTFNDLFAGETREVLVQLALPTCIPEDEGGSSYQIMKAVLEWIDPSTGQQHTAEQLLAVKRTANAADPAASATPDPLVLNTMARYATADALKEAAKLGEAGDLDKACKVLDDHVQLMKSQSTAIQLPEVELYCKQASHMATEIKTAAEARKNQNANFANLASSSACFMQQRAANAGAFSCTPAANMYDNKGKATVRARSNAYSQQRSATPAPPPAVKNRLTGP